MCNKEYAEWEAPADYIFEDHFSVQDYYWKRIYKKHGFDIDIPSDLGVNYNFLLDASSKKELIEDFTSTTGKKVLIFNQKTRSGQSDNQDYKSYLVRVANIFSDCHFLYTNEEDIDDKLILDNNLYILLLFLGEHESDIIHNAYLSLHCDVIIGRANGPYMYAQQCIMIMYKDDDKVIIGQHNGNDRKDDLEIYFNRRHL